MPLSTRERGHDRAPDHINRNQGLLMSTHGLPVYIGISCTADRDFGGGALDIALLLLFGTNRGSGVEVPIAHVVRAVGVDVKLGGVPLVVGILGFLDLEAHASGVVDIRLRPEINPLLRDRH